METTDEPINKSDHSTKLNLVSGEYLGEKQNSRKLSYNLASFIKYSCNKM